jgi:hypothetical protein
MLTAAQKTSSGCGAVHGECLPSRAHQPVHVRTAAPAPRCRSSGRPPLR